MDIENQGTQSTQGTQQQQQPSNEESTYAKIEKALRKKEPEIYSKARRELAEEIGIDLDDIESAKENLQKFQSAKSESEKLSSEMMKIKKMVESEKAEKLKLQEELNSHKRKLEDRLINDAIVQGSEKYKVRNITQVAKLLRDNFIVEDGKIKIIDDEGQVSNKKVEDVLDNFYKNNEHFLIAQAPQGGAGSRPSSIDKLKSNNQNKELLNIDGREAAFLKIMQEERAKHN
jgi:hypothetical protein